MHVERVVLTNFGCFAARELDFVAPGLTVIQGPMGAGKSTLMRALRLALTGAVDGAKGDEIRDVAETTEPAMVAVTFGHQSQRYVVRRALRQGKSTLALAASAADRDDGAALATGERDVAAAMDRILGDQLATVRDFCFVGQGQMTTILQDGTASRSRLLQTLCDGPRAERIHRQLGDRLAGIAIPDVAIPRASAQARLAELEATRADLERERAERPSAPDLDVVAGWRRALAAADQADARDRERERDRQRQERDRADLADERRALASSRQDWDDLVQKIADEPAVELVAAEIARLTPVVAALTGAAVACPTCGTPVAALQATIAEATERLGPLRETLDRLRAWERWRRGLEDRHRTIERRCRALVAAIAARAEQLDAGDDDDGPRLASEERTRLVAAVAAADQAVRDQAVLDQRLALVVQEWDRVARELADLDQAAQRSRRLGQAVADLREVRQGFHHDAAPRIATARALRLLEAACNDLLTTAGIGFVVEASDDMTFLVTDDRGGRRGARRLSGGQQVFLSLALRVALNAVFAADLGFLALDEPTYFLDKDTLQGMEAAFDYLKTVAVDRGLQCLVVTHEERILRMFDHVIALGG